ncbi:TPA: hypothetical protein DCX15_04995 [bacterium]|nr:hypothetical protein [bacterium]
MESTFEVTKEERASFLKNFARSREWRKIRESILVRLTAPYWMMDEDGNYLSEVKQNRSYCQMIKETMLGAKNCQDQLTKGLEQMKEKRGPIITRCRAGIMGFISPLILEDIIIGVIGGCQIIDSGTSLDVYRNAAVEFGLDDNKFISCLHEQEAISWSLLEVEVHLIHLLAQSSIEIVIQKGIVNERDILLNNLVRFYRSLEERRDLFLRAEPEELYQLIVQIISKSINCEVCSLMLVDPRTNLLNIQAAVGLPPEVVRRTSVKIGEGVSGWVAVHGKPLLVKDITQDPRFRPASTDRYYTNSLISTPIKIDQKTIGVLNANNEASRRIFNEGDLRLLGIIAEHAAVTIEGIKGYEKKKHEEWIATHTLEERQEALRLQAERMKAEMERRIEEEAEEKERLKRETERLTLEVSRIEELRKTAEQLQHEALSAKEAAEKERLKIEAARLQVEAEDLEHRKETESLRQQVENLRSEVKHLKSEESNLKKQLREAEELLVHAEQAGALEEETKDLRRQIALMKEEEERLRTQIAEVERLRARAEEAERLRAQTRELTTLYELSKEIISIPEPKEIPPWTLEKIQPLLNCDISAYILLEGDGLVSEIKPFRPVSEEFIDEFKSQMIENSKSLLSKAKKPIKLDFEIKSEEMIIKGGSFERPRISYTSFIDRDSPTGILYVGHQPKNGDEELIRRVLPIVGVHVSTAIEKLRIYLETKDLVDRDELTGLYNFRYFGRRFMEEFKLSVRNRRYFALLMIDFDYLKKFNDTFGHEEGNRLIKAIAGIIKLNIRDVDILARFGGDEFVAILPETSGAQAKEVAERILEALRSYEHIIEGKPYKITASIGLSSYPELMTKTAKDFFMRTDEALYQAKGRGRNQVYVYGSK